MQRLPCACVGPCRSVESKDKKCCSSLQNRSKQQYSPLLLRRATRSCWR